MADLVLRLALQSPEERVALRGALVAARATQLGEARRHGSRLFFGYGSDSARLTMGDAQGQAEARVVLLDRLIAALDAAEQAGEA